MSFARKELFLGTLLFTLMSLPTGLLAQIYSISDIASSSWSYSEAHGISGLGSVVGEFEATTSFNVLAFLYTNATITELGHLGGTPYAVAYGVNDNAVVGESDTGINTHAFVYKNGTMTDLGILGNSNGGGYSSAHAINRSGAIVGEASVSFNQASTIHAVLYNGNTKTDLGALGGDYSSATAINNSNLIVGESDIVQQGITNVHAFIYTNGAIHDLGTLGGGYSSAKGINDSGVVVGEAETVIDGVTYLRAFVYRNGAMVDLGTLGGSVSSASAINTSGEIVGYATDTNEVSNAFLYDRAQMVNLNNFIPAGSAWTNLTSADAINDAGQIAGSGYLADGSFHAYLLTPSTGSLTVNITQPSANANFQAPATFVITASPSDGGGAVTNVQFLVNHGVIANDTSAPYSATAIGLSAGSYTLMAVASDDAGLRATNAISISVTNSVSAPLTILNPSFGANGFSFSFATQTGLGYQVQFTGSLKNNWLVFTNLTGNGSTLRVTDTTAPRTQRYYRILAQ